MRTPKLDKLLKLRGYELLESPNPLPKAGGVYLLWNGTQLDYVGATQAVAKRLSHAQHHVYSPGKHTVDVILISYPRERFRAEADLISLLHPLENRHYPPTEPLEMVISWVTDSESVRKPKSKIRQKLKPEKQRKLRPKKHRKSKLRKRRNIVTARVTDATKIRLQELAEGEGMTISAYVYYLILRALERAAETKGK